MVLEFIKIALTRIQIDRCQTRDKLRIFPEVGRDGAKDFAAEVCRNFFDNRLELRDCCGLLPGDLGVCIPLEVAVINPGCKGPGILPPP